MLTAAGSIGQASGDLLRQIGENETDERFQVRLLPPAADSIMSLESIYSNKDVYTGHTLKKCLTFALMDSKNMRSSVTMNHASEPDMIDLANHTVLIRSQSQLRHSSTYDIVFEDFLAFVITKISTIVYIYDRISPSSCQPF